MPVTPHAFFSNIIQVRELWVKKKVLMYPMHYYIMNTLAPNSHSEYFLIEECLDTDTSFKLTIPIEKR